MPPEEIKPQPIEQIDKKVRLDKYFLLLSVFLCLLFFIVTGFLFYKNRELAADIADLKSKSDSLESEAEQLQSKNTDLEKELIFYKNTDLAKELELLQLKLDTLGKEFDDTKKELSQTEGMLTTIQTNTQKVKPYLDAINAIETLLSQGPTAGNVANVDSKIALLKDSEVSSQWARAKANIDLEKMSWSGSEISETVSLMTSRIGELTR